MLNINKTIRRKKLPPKHDKHDGSKLTYGKYCQTRFGTGGNRNKNKQKSKKK